MNEVLIYVTTNKENTVDFFHKVCPCLENAILGSEFFFKNYCIDNYIFSGYFGANGCMPVSI